MIKKILKEAGRFNWQNPFLWIFGFFAIPLTTLESNIIISGLNQIQKTFSYLPLAENLSKFKINQLLSPFFFQNLIITLTLIFIIFILATLAQICLINSTKKELKNLFFSKIISLSKHHFWPIFLYNLLNLLVVSLISLIVFPFFLHLIIKFNQIKFLVLFFIFILLIFLFFSLVASFITKFSIFYFILEEKKRFFEALKNGYFFFYQNFFSIFGFFIILILISLIFAIGLFLILSTTSVPFFMFISFLYFLRSSFGLTLTFSLILIIYFTLTFLISSIFSSFQLISWVFFFKNKISPKCD
jgi:hypothetical protein